MQQAAEHMEAEDIEDGAYRVFDRLGQELRVAVPGPRVVIAGEIVGADPIYLADQLRRHLRKVPARRRRLSDEDVLRAELTELVDEFARLGSARTSCGSRRGC